MVDDAIVMHDVSKRFGATVSVHNLSLNVARGDVFGFLGPNGAGKTTTLRILLGLVRPDAGTVSVLGHDPRLEANRIRALVGVLLENDGLYDRLSAWDNLAFHARIHKLAPDLCDRRIRELLEGLGLFERRRDMVVSWSKGMRQKLAIARALIHRPQILLLDEPFSGLDPAAAVELRASIVALAREQDTTVLLTTHDLAHVEKACNRVAVIAAGRILATGSPDELVEGRKDEIFVEIVGGGLSEPILESLRGDRLLLTYRFDGRMARVSCSRETRPLLGTELVKRGVLLEELHTVRSSLEEAFMSIVSAAPARASA